MKRQARDAMARTAPRGDSVNYTSSTLFPRYELLFCDFASHFNIMLLYFLR